jgi:hypothetical protein
MCSCKVVMGTGRTTTSIKMTITVYIGLGATQGAQEEALLDPFLGFDEHAHLC